MAEIRIVLVEDHDLTRIGLRTTLQQQSDLQVIGEAADAATGLALLSKLTPDVALIDIDLPDTDGIELTRQLRELQANQTEAPTRVLILTMHDNSQQVLAAFAAGADSYCVKTIKTDQLVEAIHTTYEGNGWIDPAIANVVLKQIRQETATVHDVSIHGLDPEDAALLEANALTDRELDVLELIVAGYSNAEIGEKLFLSLGTVKTHVRNILAKMAASDRTQAAVRALRSGLIK
ncbi:MAG: response regulator transcription factor [Leptolyngbyaceae cyanobacterium MO_188.B28]|nr:response regulator transcription factor [Leptolyngbyaceae cyanobacterium MO_188.B28]